MRKTRLALLTGVAPSRLCSEQVSKRNKKGGEKKKIDEKTAVLALA